MIYALPSDGADRALDTDGTAAASVSNFQGWLSGQTGGRGLKVDTSGGQVDITFHRFTETDAQLAAYGINLRDAIESRLRSAGFDAYGKLYSVYYDGTGPHDHCGGGAWPPDLPARSARSICERPSAPDRPVTTRISRGPGSRSWISRSCTRRCTPWASFRAVRLIRPVQATRPTTRRTSCGQATETGIRRCSITATTITSTPTFRAASTWPTAHTFRAGHHFRRRHHRHRRRHLRLHPPPPPPPTRCRVPRVVGLTLGRARTRIRARHCSVGRVRRARSRRRRAGALAAPLGPRHVGPRGLRVNLLVGRR